MAQIRCQLLSHVTQTHTLSLKTAKCGKAINAAKNQNNLQPHKPDEPDQNTATNNLQQPHKPDEPDQNTATNNLQPHKPDEPDQNTATKTYDSTKNL